MMMINVAPQAPAHSVVSGYAPKTIYYWQ